MLDEDSAKEEMDTDMFQDKFLETEETGFGSRLDMGGKENKPRMTPRYLT